MENNLWKSTKSLMHCGPKVTFSSLRVSQLTGLELSL